jgi:hypothetical protein
MKARSSGWWVWVTGSVPPDRGNRRQFGVAQVLHFEPVVVDLEIEVVVARHQQRARADRAQRLRQVTAVERVVADVAVLPGPELGQQVRSVTAREVAVPEANQVILDRSGAEGTPQLLPVEGLRQGPAGIDAPHGLEAAHRRFGEDAVAVGGVGLQRVCRALDEDAVVRRATRRATDYGNAFHGVRVHRGPVVGLHGAHRPAVDEGDAMDAEHFGQHLLLHPHGIVHGDVRIRCVRQLGRRVRRRTRKPVSEQVQDDDEVARRIEGGAIADHELRIRVLGAVRRGIEDDVRLVRVQRAEGLVGKLHARQDAAALQLDVQCLVDLVVRAHVRIYTCRTVIPYATYVPKP